MSDAEDGTTVAVTSKGQATIPKEFRDKLHIALAPACRCGACLEILWESLPAPYS